MNTFEYLAVLISIVVGLALTHVLSAIGRVISNSAREKLFWVHSLWTLYVLVQLVYFWWFELGFRTVNEWTGMLYAFVVLYSIALYLQCVIVVPSEPQSDYHAYFFAKRTWIYGFLVITLLIDLLDTWLKPELHAQLMQNWQGIVVRYVVMAALFGGAMFTKKAWYHGLIIGLLLISLLDGLLFRPEPG